MSIALSEHKFFKSLLLCTAALAAGSLHAATCSVISASLNLGLYDALAANPNLSSGSVRVSCSKEASAVTELVTVTLQLMPSSTTANGSRKLVSGSEMLAIGLYTDLLRTRPWGDGTQGTFTLTGMTALTVANSTVILDFPVYGSVPTRQSSAASSYAGLFTIQLTF